MITREIQLPEKYSFFLLGPRQTGKTTLILSRFPDSLTIDLLDTTVFLELMKQPSLLRERVAAAALKKGSLHVFIDEVQKIPTLLDEVHSLIEKYKKSPTPVYFILSGSSARKIKRGGANLLAGRALSYRLHPYTLREIDNMKSVSLIDILTFGTLPPIFDIEDIAIKKEFLRSYVETYLKEEIVAEALTRNLGGFLRFLQTAGQMNGEQINSSAISRDVGLSHVTIKDYFLVLQDTMMGFFLQSYSQSERKRHKVSEKFYFFDTGVVRGIQENLGNQLMPKSFEFGNLFESWVINEVVRFSDYFRKDFKLSFLRTANDVEVDLLIETPQGKLIAIEIKSKELPQSTDYSSGFEALAAIRKPDLKIVVCTTKTDRLADDVHILAYQSFFKMLEKFEYTP